MSVFREHAFLSGPTEFCGMCMFSGCIHFFTLFVQGDCLRAVCVFCDVDSVYLHLKGTARYY